ncbi:MAG TPA: carboxypeptidase regulatory-like domain-containing protein [Bryobacteraceae bacterium]|nr:carboxypeptidase regulatory-like domain-containing protein [Bryobacteraceae bacterium]
MKYCFVAVVSLGLSGLAFSQGFGTIVGTVTDPSGALVAAAKVTATESATGVSREAETNASGGFVIPGLRPTAYTLTIDAPGFNKYSQSNILLTADQSATVNVALTLGQASQAVTVETSVVQTDTYSSTLKEVVDQQRMVDLPLNGRNAASLATLVPGAVMAPNGGADQGQTKTFPGAVTITTNGSRQNMVSYNLDGIDNVDRYTNVNMPFPFPDALQEFSVQTANYTAEYGRDGGGVVNVITKGGTNQFHGDFFGFLRNGAMNARNFFAAKTDSLKRGQEGGTIGGPVRKNKTFFFAGYQVTTLRNVNNGLNKYVPTQAEQSGDFSALLSATDPNNPTSKAQIIKDPTTGVAFPNNQIPLGRFDKAAIGVMKFLPSVGGTGIAFYSSPLHQNFDDVVGRLDQVFSDKDHFNAHYDYQLFTNKAVYNPANILSYADGSDIVAQNSMIQETHIFNPNLLNEFRAGFIRAASIRGPSPDVPSVRTFGVTIPYQPPANDVQSINVSGFFSFGDNPFARFTRNTFLGNDDVRWVLGRHNLTIGFDIERRQVLLDNGFNSPGLFTFNGGASGVALSDFVLGSLYQFQQAQGQFENTNAWSQGYFIQDTFKASSRLTINAGLRWEPYAPWHEVFARVSGFSPQNYYAGITSKIFVNAPPGLLFRGDAGFPDNGVQNNYKNFAPRVGFAYDVFGDGKTSLRGGIGMFYDSATTGIFNNNMVSESPFALQVLLTGGIGPFSNPLGNLPQYQNVFPAPVPPPHNVVFPTPVAAQTFNMAGGFGPFQVPLLYSWNLTLEHQFGSQWLGRIGYVGSHATHLSDSIDLNPAVYKPGSTASADARRTFQPFGSILQTDASGNSNYNSLQLTIQKRYAHGMSVLANYTWQKSLDSVPPNTGGTGSVTGGTPPIPWYLPGSRQLDYGPSEFNRQHVFVVSYLWDIPGPRTGNKLVTRVLGGWELSGIVTAETGLPFSVYAGKDVSQTALNADRGVYLGGAALGDTACHSAPCVGWINPAAFALPAAGTFGNVGKGAMTGPGMFNWDMGVFKNIPITERWRAQLRGEFFNTFNHSNFTSASNNYPTQSLSSAGFGTITTAYDPRILQVALKVTF